MGSGVWRCGLVNQTVNEICDSMCDVAIKQCAASDSGIESLQEPKRMLAADLE